MLRKHTLLFLALALALSATAASAAGNFQFGVMGGLGIPMGDFADDDTTSASALGGALGYTVGVSGDYWINDQFALGADVGFSGNGINSDWEDDLGIDGNWTQIQFGVHGKYRFPMQNSNMMPYLAAGLGGSNFKGEFDSGGVTFFDESKTGLGAWGGLGLGWKASEVVTINLQGDFNYTALDEDTFGASSATWVGVRAGLAFALASAGGGR